jgi:ubiquinone/menaquinone biosynthesis C-methylase UbiE
MRFRTSDNIHIESGLLTHLMNWLVLKRFPEQEVDWERYAEQYDEVTIDVNRAYQETMNMLKDGKLAELLQYEEAEVACDFGAGTGNLSIPLAKKYPNLKVIHADFSEEFNAKAKEKALGEGIHNIEFIKVDSEQIRDAYNKPFDVVLMVHSLYAMRSKDDMEKPNRVLSAVHDSLAEGGRLCIVDIEREMNYVRLVVSSIWNTWRKYGLKETIERYRRLDQAKLQNKNVILGQRNGNLITQDINELETMVKKAGFDTNENILYKSGFESYFGYDNILIVKK